MFKSRILLNLKNKKQISFSIFVKIFMKKQKVILAVTTDLNYDQRVQRIANSLAKKFEVLVVGRLLPDSKPIISSNYEQRRLKCFFKHGFGMYAAFNIRLFFFLLFKKYHFVTANDLDTVVGVYFSSFFKNSTLVFDAHEYFVEVTELENRKFVKNIWAFIEKNIAVKFDKFYTVNQSLADIFKDRLNKNFVVVRNLPFKKNKQFQTEAPKYIFYQGAVNKGRGLENLILAMRSFKEKYMLKIAGDGDILEDLKILVQKEKLEENVIFLGKITPSELPKYTEQAFAGVNLLENTSLNYYYSLANKFFDYVQAEIPQIGMNFPEYQLLNKQHEVSILIEDIEIETIVEAIQKLENSNTYQHIIAQTKLAKNEWCWENEKSQLFKAYK